MDTTASSKSLQRTSSQHSYTSNKSARSQTTRIRSRKHTAPFMSSSASSITTSRSTSDKSLTSFPSLSPESPEYESSAQKRSVVQKNISADLRTSWTPPASTVDELSANLGIKSRSALFDDVPLNNKNVPGTIHNLTTEHIENLIARNGAVALVRQIAGDLAERDAQIADIRRKAEDRERALKKIILECGLSSLDLETRLRTIEGEQRVLTDAKNKRNSGTGIEDLMSDAMNNAIRSATALGKHRNDNDATIRAVDKLRTLDEKNGVVSKGWREFLWGSTVKKTSRTSNISRDAAIGDEFTTTWAGPAREARKTVLQNEIFQPPGIGGSVNQPSNQQCVISEISHERKPSLGLTALALRLVAGRKDSEFDSDRGRSNSTGASVNRSRLSSTASVNTTSSVRTVPLKSLLVKVPPESIIGSRHTLKSAKSSQNLTSLTSHERWNVKRQSSLHSTSSRAKLGPDNSGPVEMDTILPLDEQPPTLSQINNRQCDSEFLTDRYGFIYDHRRKKRLKEADIMPKSKREIKVETLSSGRSAISVDFLDSDLVTEAEEEERPDTSNSIEAKINKGKSVKRWQDHLSIATFPTELLSHTPSRAITALDVMEGSEAPKSPLLISEERGFLPSVSTTASQPTLVVTSDNAIISNSSITVPLTPAEISLDTEPVKLLLRQLGDVHDSLQREKTIRWNDFLRKVRAERKRDGEAAASVASNLASNNDTRSQRPVESMPETMLANGEMIGVAGLGNKGKIGRAKWNEFKTLVLGGIPVAYRAKIWAECSGASTLRIPGYYESLISKSKVDDDPVIIAQINMDVNRTLTDNIYFRKGPGVNKLNEVLLAYCRRNPEVGYCQGMNLITACLLLIMPTAEDAFWFLTSIIENILPQGYYDHSLIASRADQQVLRQYVSEILPKLSTHLDNLSIELEALTFQWFLSVFTDCLSAEALFRVWDVVFCFNDGSTFLFQVALALLKLNESQLLQCETPARVYTYINHQMTNHAISIDGLIHASEGLRKVVKREAVEKRRARAIEAEHLYTRQREEMNTLKKAESLDVAPKLDKSDET